MRTKVSKNADKITTYSDRKRKSLSVGEELAGDSERAQRYKKK